MRTRNPWSKLSQVGLNDAIMMASFVELAAKVGTRLRHRRDCMNKLKLRLMYQEALKRLRDAETLTNEMPFEEHSDSPYLLRLLGLELMVKLVYEHALGRVGNGHAYDLLFQELPSGAGFFAFPSRGRRLPLRCLDVRPRQHQRSVRSRYAHDCRCRHSQRLGSTCREQNSLLYDAVE